MLVDLTVEEVMNSPAEQVGPDATAVDVARKLRENEIGSLVVVDDGALGIVTETDLVDILADRKDPTSLTADEFMSTPILTVEPQESIEDAAKKMKQNKIKKLPVVEDSEVVGVITTTDVSNYIPKIELEWSEEVPD